MLLVGENEHSLRWATLDLRKLASNLGAAMADEETKVDLSVQLLLFIHRVHYSSNKHSKITAGFDKEARAHFKGVKHGVFQGLRKK